ncbi:hypothetical protein NBRC116188_11760 [Oceaniserpentilla sp. 4NH20-0058]|uniref:GNAT family N-acetyltransferase n=1 Tax=Oceaniserpentilla sp. 4NH20-0058 TaxID=3127660 RepID=UPI003105F11C
MRIRLFQVEDTDQLNQIAVEAFSQFEHHYSDWQSLITAVGNMANLAQSAHLFVAEDDGKIVGGVALVPPNDNPNSHFDKTWTAIRMLVVSPEYRGKGIGKALTHTCLDHAKQSDVKTIGLHTSPIMEVALAMYQRMGFEKFKDIDPIFGVEYGVYKLEL